MIVVSYGKTTSNHNQSRLHTTDSRLYLMEKLHQTTTSFSRGYFSSCCILWKNYIKPQLTRGGVNTGYVVSYGKTTSNHNKGIDHLERHEVVSYGKTTSNHNSLAQTINDIMLYLMEKLHQTTTNLVNEIMGIRLYLMEKLHQTTTCQKSN